MALPVTVRKFFSHALDFAQRGSQHDAAKVLKGFGGAGVLEVVEGLPGAEKLKIKSGLVIEITKAVRKLGLTQAEAARRMGIAQPKVSSMFRGDFSNLSERKLMDCLNRLGYDIEIRLKPGIQPVGHLVLAVA